MTQYKQFQLRDGTTTTTCWLPTIKKGIVLEPGMKVTLSDAQSRWWTIENIGTTTRTKEEVKRKERIARKYRQATDI
jgi:hypothetical protein